MLALLFNVRFHIVTAHFIIYLMCDRVNVISIVLAFMNILLLFIFNDEVFYTYRHGLAAELIFMDSFFHCKTVKRFTLSRRHSSSNSNSTKICWGFRDISF